MSLPMYPAYKESGVEWLGELPQHWSVMRLRRCVTLNPSKSEVGHLPHDLEVSFLPMEAIGEDGRLDLERTRPIQEVHTGYTYFRDGDVAFAKITPCFENGKGALMNGLTEGVGFGTTELIVARAESGRMVPSYLSWLVRSPGFRDQGEASMYGAGGQKRVPDDFVRELACGIPPLHEQTAIATFLDRETAKIDALIAEQEKLIALLAEKRQATISHAVTRGLDPNASMKESGVPWLGEVPAQWEIQPLKRVCTLLKDGTHLPPPRVDIGVPLLSVRNIGGSKFSTRDDDSNISDHDYKELCRTFTPQPSDVVLAIVGATLGKAAIVPAGLGRFHIQRSLAIFRTTHDVAPPWLFNCFSSGGFQRLLWEYAGFSAQPGIYLGTLRDFKIPVPTREEQLRICAILDNEIARLDTLVRDAEMGIALLHERRSALIAAAVTGQIDVRGTVPRPAPQEAVAA